MTASRRIVQAVPILVRILSGDRLSMNTRNRAAMSLGRIKASDRQSISALVKAATTLVTSDSDIPVPLIINGRNSSDLSVELRWHAVRALGQIGNDAREALPALLETVCRDKGLYPGDVIPIGPPRYTIVCATQVGGELD